MHGPFGAANAPADASLFAPTPLVSLQNSVWKISRLLFSTLLSNMTGLPRATALFLDGGLRALLLHLKAGE